MSESLEKHRQEAHELLEELVETSSSPEQYKSVLRPGSELLEDAIVSWNTADLIAYLEGLEFSLRDSQRKIVDWAATIRNILVFTPVALTWHAISVATAGFDAFLKDNPEVPANFLQFWQDGYGYIDPIWTIGSVANLDFLLVLAVIVLTGYVSFSNQRFKDRAREHLSRANSKRSILRAKLLLISQASGGSTSRAGESDLVASLKSALQSDKELQARGMLASQLRAFLAEIEQPSKTKQ